MFFSFHPLSLSLSRPRNVVWCNLPPVFTEDMNNLALSEATPVGFNVYKLEGYDPEGSDVAFGLIGSEHFDVDAKTGDVKVIKALDREVSQTTVLLQPN